MPGAALVTLRTCSRRQKHPRGVRSDIGLGMDYFLIHSALPWTPGSGCGLIHCGTATLRLQVLAKRRDLVNSTQIGQVRNGQTKRISHVQVRVVHGRGGRESH